MSASNKTNLLVAFPYLKGKLLKSFERTDPESFRLLIDSGAFSAFNSGKEIDVDEYIDFVKAMPFKPWGHFALDVIGDPAETKRNYQKMLDAGLSPIPVWTTGQNLDEFEALYEHSEVVGIGGLVGPKGKGHKGNATWRIQQAMKRAKGRKVHWLGYGNPQRIQRHRPFSADTSSWLMGTRFGNLRLYRGGGQWTLFYSPRVKSQGGGKTSFRKPSPEEEGLLLSYGVRSEDLLLESFWDSQGPLNDITTRSYLRYQRECERNGTLFFLAVASVGVDEIQRIGI